MFAPTGQSIEAAVSEMQDSLGGLSGMPSDEELSDDQITKAFTDALQGVDLRAIDEHGVRCDGSWSVDDWDEFPDDYPNVYVVLRWRELPVRALPLRLDGCELLCKALARYFYHLEGLAVGHKLEGNLITEGKLGRQMRLCTELRQQLAELDYSADSSGR
jgi:hypothetical protein